MPWKKNATNIYLPQTGIRNTNSQKWTKIIIIATLPLTNAEVDEQKNDSDHDTHAADDDVRNS